jgi:ubiquinone/menaquinone biosynthesis C-methylase UbiE
MITSTNVLEKAFSGFSDVDHSGDPNSFIKYLDTSNVDEEVRHIKLQFIKLLDPQKGWHVLDIGCGLGHDTHVLAKMVGRTGRVVGLDKSTALIREARRRLHDVTLPLEFRAGDAHHLDFPDNTFHGCLVSRTFMHLEHPRKALAEIGRVLKPGGRLAALEPDWDTLVMTTGKTAITRKIVEILRQSMRQSGIAHKLPMLFQQAGFRVIAVQARTFMVRDYDIANEAWRIQANVENARKAGLLSSVEARNLLSHLRWSSQNGLFFGAATGFAVIGQKI